MYWATKYLILSLISLNGSVDGTTLMARSRHSQISCSPENSANAGSFQLGSCSFKSSLVRQEQGRSNVRIWYALFHFAERGKNDGETLTEKRGETTRGGLPRGSG